MVPHPFAKCAKGWGTLVHAAAEKKQVLRFAQDDNSQLLFCRGRLLQRRLRDGVRELDEHHAQVEEGIL